MRRLGWRSAIAWAKTARTLRVPADHDTSLDGAPEAPPAGSPPTLVSVAPSWGSEDGGTTVWVKVDNSAGIVSGTIGGVAVTGLTIIDATTVRCVTGAHAVGLGNVVLTNAFGASAPLVGGFLYFDPTDANYAPTQSFIAPEYDDTIVSPVGPWVARTGSTLSAGADAPSADAGGAHFVDTTNLLSNADASASWYGIGDHHVVAIVDIDDITNDDTGNVYGNAAVFRDSGADIGLTIYRTGSGPYSYFATLFENSGGIKVATLDITSLVDASGAGTLVLEGKKEGGSLQIRANGGAWTVGDACGDLSVTSGVLYVGRGYGGARIHGTIRALVISDAAKDAAYSDLVQQWAPRVPSGWVRRREFGMPAEFVTRQSCMTFRLASGRLLIVGGFNPTAGAIWNFEWVTNEVWASDDDGETWTLLLAHDTDPPTSGAGARFRPCHSVPFCTASGVAYLAGVDPTFQTTGSGDVWKTTDGETWTRVTTTAPCLNRTMCGMGAIGSTLYMGGGQGVTLDESTRIRDWWKSEDGGATWTELALPPWSARGMIYNLPEIDGKIYLLGGGVYDDGPLTPFNGVYSFDGADWTEVLPDGHAQWSALLYSVPCAFKGRLWLFNGYDNDSTLDVYRALYSDDLGATWQTFVGGSGGAVGGPSHADTVVAGTTRIVRLAGYSTGSEAGRPIHSFALESEAA